MSILNELASAQNRRDEELNQQLAARLCENPNLDETQEQIQELVDNLNHKNKNTRSDCIKVLYEIGACKPELIDIYVDEFVAVLTVKDNRMVWGAMTALGSIASLKPHDIWQHVDTIIETTENGSVITQDWGMRVLAALSAVNEDYASHIFPFLIHFLEGCKSKDVPRHAESIVMAATTPSTKAGLHRVLEQHQPNLKPSQLKRVNKLLQNM